MIDSSDGMLRVFWPNTLIRSTTPGVIVGWRNSALDLFVVTILEDVEVRTCASFSLMFGPLTDQRMRQVRSVESALRMGTLFRNSPYPVARIFQLCDRSNMHVLGTLNHPHIPDTFDPTKICAFILPDNKRPFIYCPVDAGLSVQVVLFDPPNPNQLQYISLRPISLTLGRPSEPKPSSKTMNEIEVEDVEERKRTSQLVTKLRFHTVIRHDATPKEMALGSILRQINCAQEVADLLQKNSPLVGPRRKRSLSVSERVVESAQSLYSFAAWSLWTLFMTYAFPTLLWVFKIAVICHHILAEGVLQVLEYRLPFQKRSDDSSVQGDPLALKDISACCQQVHLRLQQFSYYPAQYSLLQKRHATWSSFPTTNSDYIRFYNSLWLVANDVIIGIAMGSFINENAQATAQFLSYNLDQYMIEGLKSMIRWLMSYPGGLKLNTELAAFLGDLFLWVIEYWSSTLLVMILPRLPTIVYVIGFSSFAGASMPIAIFSDLLGLMTLHIYSFYVASARIFNWQLTIISSLFHLFRGKKRNVLRNRIDNCDYDLDQLLLGTILFTLLFFLLPTVVVFYLTFASARMAIITVKATLDTCLACLNHFPLFALMLRVKDSKRLPGGVHFQLLETEQIQLPAREETPKTKINELDKGQDQGQGQDRDQDQDQDQSQEEDQEPISMSVAYVSLSSIPLSLRQIFEQYFHLWARIQHHYLSPKVIFRLLTGGFVPPLGRHEMYGLQYSALPRERASVAEVWKSLSEAIVESPSSTSSSKPSTSNLSLGQYGRAIGKRWK